MLKNFPIPKLSLHHRTDLATLAPHREVVDGQQRTMLSVISSMEISPFCAGYGGVEEQAAEDLSRADQRQFLNYGLNFDLLVGPKRMRFGRSSGV